MMDIYVLDEDFAEVEVIDGYMSLVWTERFDENGDFELQIAPSEKVRHSLKEGTVLSIPESNRMMVVEEIAEKVVEDELILEIKGPSFESILDNRVAWCGPSGSTNAWLSTLVRSSLIEGTYDEDDKLSGLQLGTNAIYPASTLPPSTLPAPIPDSGWVSLGTAHDDSRKLSPLGYRFVRRPGTRTVYYDNYTGHNKSAPGVYDVSDTTLSWSDPFFDQTYGDTVVWRNLFLNPGFTEGYRQFSEKKLLEYDVYGEIEVSEVEANWTKSGKGLKIVSSSGRTQANQTRTVITDGAMHLSTMFRGAPLWGRTFTMTAKVKVDTVMSGTQSAYARSIVVVAGTPYVVATAPNTVGIHNLSLTFTLPAQGNSAGVTTVTVSVWNGNGVTDEGVTWGDFCLVELPSNPVGYFDAYYSPDPDLIPAFENFGDTTSPAVLLGRAINGVSSRSNCVLIQSSKWSKDGGVSARMIRNKPGTGCNARLLFKDSRYFEITQNQTQVLTGAGSKFGVVDLQKGSTVVASSAVKPNTVSERTVKQTPSTVVDNVFLYGDFAQLGGSMYWDLMIVHSSPTWTRTPNAQVIFAEDLDSFIVSQSLSSIEKYRNVVYVTHGKTVVKVDDGDMGEHLKRRVTHVDGDNLDDGPGLQAAMVALGRQELANNRRTRLIDGEVPVYSRYSYDVDYSLGDIVLVRNRAGKLMASRVMEQIFINDNEGYRTYPTLQEEQSVILGEWSSPAYKIVWPIATGTWSNQP